jgi:membrane dipeptidase
MHKLEAEHPNDPKAVRDGVTAFQAAHPLPKATIALVADHIDHIRQVAGVDHVGLDPTSMASSRRRSVSRNVSTYPKLTAELLRRGWSDDDIRKLLGLNVCA